MYQPAQDLTRKQIENNSTWSNTSGTPMCFFWPGWNGSDRIDTLLQEQQRKHIARTANYMEGARIVASTNSLTALPLKMAELFSDMLPVRLVSPPTGMPEIEIVTLHHLFDNDSALCWLLERLHKKKAYLSKPSKKGKYLDLTQKKKATPRLALLFSSSSPKWFSAINSEYSADIIKESVKL